MSEANVSPCRESKLKEPYYRTPRTLVDDRYAFKNILHALARNWVAPVGRRTSDH